MMTLNPRSLSARSTLIMTLCLTLFACEEPQSTPSVQIGGERVAGEESGGQSARAGEPSSSGVDMLAGGEPSAGSQAGSVAGEPSPGGEAGAEAGAEAGLNGGVEPAPMAGALEIGAERAVEEEPSSERLTPEEELEAPLAAPPPPVELPHRPRRRVNLDQLDRAIEQSVGLPWTELSRGEQVRSLTVLSDTLGKPDYIRQTVEDLSPSALFLKFLDDSARTVCSLRVELDLTGLSEGGEPVSWSDEDWGPLWGEGQLGALDSADLDERLRALSLRFHGLRLPAGDHPRLAYWRWLYETVSFVSDEPHMPWVALCVAMLNHPDFYSY